MKNLYLVPVLCASLIGCTPMTRQESATSTAMSINSEVEAQLINAAQSIERSLQSLALTQETSNPPLLNTVPLITAEGGMGGSADIDWTGPIEPLVNKLAEMTDYRVKVLGNEPAIPIIISISQQKAIIADILKNASLQAGKRANIMVFPANRVIEIRYRAMG